MCFVSCLRQETQLKFKKQRECEKNEKEKVDIQSILPAGSLYLDAIGVSFAILYFFRKALHLSFPPMRII